jgi:endonuclease YncB( thermonuclease family)
MRDVRSLQWPFSTVVLSVLLVVPFSRAFAGDSVVGKITAIKSAEVVTLDYGAGTYDIRIAGIELPKDRTMRSRASEALSRMVLGKTVRLRFYGRGPDGLMYGRLLIGGIGSGRASETVRDVGVELVRAGFFQGFNDGYKYGEMTQAEAEARANRRGLWRQQ